ncbi:MAG TPA: hypothetical protein VE986_06435 [Hyphomicrobiales bacterium]|nr:hypothetical protein [Hyphomicrobiales bacterium]
MLSRALGILILCAAAAPSFGQETKCDTGAFREVVASASASINELHEKNSKLFQEYLRKLRAANNWSDAEYLMKATPFVKDETTASLDAANQSLLAKVQSLEAGAANSEAGRCAMLNELKASMEKVVANTIAKWEHMLSKLLQASSTTLQAGVTQ